MSAKQQRPCVFCGGGIAAKAFIKQIISLALMISFVKNITQMLCCQCIIDKNRQECSKVCLEKTGHLCF
jgi:hypothetical protein